LLDVIALEQDLAAVLGRPVEVLTEGASAPTLQQRILAKALELRKTPHLPSAHPRRITDIAIDTNAGRDGFFAERMRQDATLRKLEVIGQAVKNLSEETKSRRPEVPGNRSLACATTSFTTISA
jgi:hypothetical protein